MWCCLYPSVGDHQGPTHLFSPSRCWWGSNSEPCTCISILWALSSGRVFPFGNHKILAPRTNLTWHFIYLFVFFWLDISVQLHWSTYTILVFLCAVYSQNSSQPFIPLSLLIFFITFERSGLTCPKLFPSPKVVPNFIKSPWWQSGVSMDSSIEVRIYISAGLPLRPGILAYWAAKHDWKSRSRYLTWAKTLWADQPAGPTSVRRMN